MTTSAIPYEVLTPRHARPARERFARPRLLLRGGLLRAADRVIDGMSSDASLVNKSLSVTALVACWSSFVAAGLALLT